MRRCVDTSHLAMLLLPPAQEEKTVRDDFLCLSRLSLSSLRQSAHLLLSAHTVRPRECLYRPESRLWLGPVRLQGFLPLSFLFSFR